MLVVVGVNLTTPTFFEEKVAHDNADTTWYFGEAA